MSTEEQQRIAAITAAGKRTPSLAAFLAHETGIDAELANAVFAAVGADLDAASQRTDPPAAGKTVADDGWAKVAAHAHRGLNADPNAVGSGEAAKSGWAGAVKAASRSAA
ncbi:hypothetical protein [Mesorhizobium sp. A556]